MKRPVAVIVLAELFGTSLWFSLNGAATDLTRAWGLTPGTSDPEWHGCVLLPGPVLGLVGLSQSREPQSREQRER